MIKKFLSNVLLSVVMDKKARRKLEMSRGGKPDNKKGKQSQKSEAANPDIDHPLKVDPEKHIASLSNALLDAPPPLPPAGEKAPTDMSHDEIEDLIKQSLQSAENELKSKPKMNPDRQALIQQALSIRNQQAKILDDLDPVQREKLTALALHTLDPGGNYKGKKGSK